MSCKHKVFFQNLPQANPKKFLSLFKSVSNTSKAPSKITWKRSEGNITAENQKTLPNFLNNYFHSMFNPPFSQEEHNNHSSSTTSSCDPITDIHVSCDHVRRTRLSLDVKKGAHAHIIAARLVRYSAPYVSSSLKDLFNKSLNTVRIPSGWKISIITPIHKGGHKK